MMQNSFGSALVIPREPTIEIALSQFLVQILTSVVADLVLFCPRAPSSPPVGPLAHFPAFCPQDVLQL